MENEQMTTPVTSTPEQGKKNNLLLMGGVILAIALLVGIFLRMKSHKNAMMQPAGNTEATQSASAAPAQMDQNSPAPTPSATASATSANVKEFTIEGGSYYFKPNQITVKKGDTVKITFVNQGGIHDLRIDEFNIKMNPIKTGETSVVTFVADKAGSFQFYCSVGHHRQMGQMGTLTVE